MIESIGFYRLPQVLAVIPVSRTDWYSGVKEGLYPQPVKIGARAVAWKKEDIHELAQQIAKGGIAYSSKKKKEAPAGTVSAPGARQPKQQHGA